MGGLQSALSYAGGNAFMDCEWLGEDDTEVGIVGLPFDNRVNGRSGAREGPRAMREASRLLTGCFPDMPILRDFGDVTHGIGRDSVSSQTTADLIAAGSQVSRGLVAMGGEHTVTLAALQALGTVYDASGITVVQFDAHADTWDHSPHGGVYHGSWVRAALEDGLCGRVLQCGVRVAGPDLGGAVVAADPYILRARVGDGPVYITLDVDVLDPAFAPGTGCPVPCGNASRDVDLWLRMLGGLTNVVGADVVEVCPAYDERGRTALVGAWYVAALAKLVGNCKT